MYKFELILKYRMESMFCPDLEISPITCYVEDEKDFNYIVDCGPNQYMIARKCSGDR